MALHSDFPRSPYAILPPGLRWFPAAEELRTTAYRRLLPPLVAKIRDEVAAWRGADYAGASATSRALLTWWFATDHLTEAADGSLRPFRYYFAQREAVETVIWLRSRTTGPAATSSKTNGKVFARARTATWSRQLCRTVREGWQVHRAVKVSDIFGNDTMTLATVVFSVRSQAHSK